MGIKVQDIIKIIGDSAEAIQNELLDCCSHFPWKEFPEGWYQFALMWHLRKAGYRTYPEYGLCGHGYKGGKADIAVLESPWDFDKPSLLIEIKSIGSNEDGFRKDANRLAHIAANNGVSGILAYFTGAIKSTKRQEEEKNFSGWCKQPIISRWHSFQQRHVTMQGVSEGGGLADKEWGLLMATYPRA